MEEHETMQIRGKRISAYSIFIFIFFIPVAFFVWYTYTQAVETVKTEKMQFVTNILEEKVEAINFLIEDLSVKGKKLSEHRGIQKTLEIFNTLDEGVKEKALVFLQEKVRETLLSSEVVKGVVVTDGEQNFLLTEGEIEQWELAQGDQVYTASNEALQWIDNTFYYNAPIFSQEGTYVGGLTFILDSAKLNKYLEHEIPDIQCQFIFYFEGKPFFSGEPFAKDFLESERVYLRNNEIIDFEKKVYLIQSRPVSIHEGYLVNLTAAEDLTRSIQKTLRRNLWVIGLSGIFMIILLFIAVYLLTRLNTKNEMVYYRLKMTEEMNEKLRVYKHDFMNHIQVILGLIQLNQKDEAVDYIYHVAGEGLNITTKIHIGYPELEALIYQYMQKTQELNIEFKLQIMELPEDFSVKIYDLTKIISNLLKNGVYALSKEDSNRKILSFDIYYEFDEYIFEVTNNIPLIQKEMQKKIFTKNFSTKEEEGDGLGLFIVKKLAEKNKGRVDLTVDEKGNHFKICFPV